MSGPRFPAPGRDLASLALAYVAALAAGLATGAVLWARGPVLAAAGADLAATLVVFAFGAALGNASLYDPYWSLAPIPIALSWSSGGSPARRLVALGLLVAWGARLTWNQLARWRGLGDEDFRYRELRARAGRAFPLASLFGIHLLPTAWVFLGLLPLYPALSDPARPPGALDAAAAAVTAGAVLLEAVADRQLRDFRRARAEPGALLERGLWARARHPNYLGEILFWWGLWLFGLAADPGFAVRAVPGPLAITLLFLLVSVPWMDRHLLSRHPAYAERLRRVPALLPRPGRPPP